MGSFARSQPGAGTLFMRVGGRQRVRWLRPTNANLVLRMLPAGASTCQYRGVRSGSYFASARRILFLESSLWRLLKANRLLSDGSAQWGRSIKSPFPLTANYTLPLVVAYSAKAEAAGNGLRSWTTVAGRGR